MVAGSATPAAVRSGLHRSDDLVALRLVGLDALMQRTEGRPEVVVGIVDGPVARHPDLNDGRLVDLGGPGRACTDPPGAACGHGTFVAGMLAARRGSRAPALCPGCSFVVRPLFASDGPAMPVATPAELAAAAIACVEAGARIVNLSAATGAPSPNEERELRDALDYVLARGAVVVAAAGNQRLLGSSPITRHPAVLPVVACDLGGRPLATSNLGRSIGVRGLLAPGIRVTSLGAAGPAETRSGTSVAAPFVTGALALLCSLFPRAGVVDAALAARRGRHRRTSVVPPLLDARAAYEALATVSRR